MKATPTLAEFMDDLKRRTMENLTIIAANAANRPSPTEPCLDPAGDLVAQYMTGQALRDSDGYPDNGEEALTLMTLDQLDTVRRWQATQTPADPAALARIDTESIKRSLGG